MIRKKTAEKSIKKGSAITKKVQFEFLAPQAQEVYLTGDFNQWDVDANPMKKDKKGIWRTAISLTPGRYEYRFVVDGNWENDPSATHCVPNEFCSYNCVRIVD